MLARLINLLTKTINNLGFDEFFKDMNILEIPDHNIRLETVFKLWISLYKSNFKEIKGI